MGLRLLGGSSQYGTIANATDLNMGSGNFTFSIWVYAADYTNGTTGILVSGRHLNGFSGFLFRAHNSDRIPVFNGTVGQTSWDISITSGTSLVDGTRNHLAITRVGDVYTLYQNGVNEGTDTQSGALHYGSAGFQLGGDSYAGVYWNNTNADFRILKGTGLTQAQIQTIYESGGNDSITDNLVCRLLMDDLPDGSTVTSMLDITGRGNNGSGVNNPQHQAFPLTLIT